MTRSCHHGQSARLRLKQRHAEGFVKGGPDEKISQGQPLHDYLAAERSHPGYSLVERGEGIFDIAACRTIADHFQRPGQIE